MQPLKCSLAFVLALGLFHVSSAMPGRYVRATDSDDGSLVTLQFADNESDLNPINSEVSSRFVFFNSFCDFRVNNNIWHIYK